jgi:hypothetical protein
MPILINKVTTIYDDGEITTHYELEEACCEDLDDILKDDGSGGPIFNHRSDTLSISVPYHYGEYEKPMKVCPFCGESVDFQVEKEFKEMVDGYRIQKFTKWKREEVKQKW